MISDVKVKFCSMQKKRYYIKHPQNGSINNIHIYPTPFKNESRILKITKTLSDNNVFDKIIIMATWEAGLPENEVLDEKRIVIRLNRKIAGKNKGVISKLFQTAEWSLKVIRFLINEKIYCVNCHSLSVLPLCVFIKVIKNTKLIYDTHELETESACSKGIRKIFSKVLEKILINYVDEIIVVNNSIAKWYQQTYKNRNISVIKNVPYKVSYVPKNTKYLRNTFNIGEKEIIFLYQGIIGHGRGIEILLNVFSKTSSNKHIIFMGYGDLIDRVHKYEREFCNIHCHKAVSPEELINYTAGADVGLSLIENICLSYYLSLPNKLYEYVSCGLPVIVSDFPNMSKFVDNYECGWKVDVNESRVGSIIASIDKDILRSKSEMSLRARDSFGWNLEEPTLLNVYRRLGCYK